MVFGDGADWRVYLSYTQELTWKPPTLWQLYPAEPSYVDVVKRAISSAGHVIVDTADADAALPSAVRASGPTAQGLADLVRGCDLYVGLLGAQYGTTVSSGGREVSSTELELDVATEAGLDRLVFLLDMRKGRSFDQAVLEDVIDGRQEAFRRRVQDSGLAIQYFASPAELEQMVGRALRELARTRQRTGGERGRGASEPIGDSPRTAAQNADSPGQADEQPDATARTAGEASPIAGVGQGPRSGKGKADLFISYSHRDERHRKELEIHLASLLREGLVEVSCDLKIMPGEQWRSAIGEDLDSADCVLLLVSPDFLASDYCYSVEMQQALQKYREGRLVVIPVIVRPADWRHTPLGELQALPKGAKPIVEWENRDSAWLSVVDGLRSVLAPSDPER